MKYPHIMVDLETLSSSPTAAIIQIGAVVFNIKELGPVFKVTIDLQSAMANGEVSASTLRWWMSQSDKARESVMNGDPSLFDALTSFRRWVLYQAGISSHSYGDEAKNEFKFWAHATFDFPILESASRSSNVALPYHHRQCRDLRTLEEFYGNRIEWPSRAGVHHDALDDAIYQARCAALMLQHAPNEVTP